LIDTEAIVTERSQSTPQKERLPNDRTQEFNEMTLDDIVVRCFVKGHFYCAARMCGFFVFYGSKPTNSMERR
jgi:hypothetical protein